MLNVKSLTERVEKWLSSIYWTHCNIRSALYGEVAQASMMHMYEPEGRSKPSFWEVQSILSNVERDDCKLVEIYHSVGPSWTTKWFRLRFNIPPSMVGKSIALRWNSSSEAMLYSSDGTCLQGFTGGGDSNCRDLYLIADRSTGSGNLEFYVEMVCNDLFGNGNSGMIFPPSDDKYYVISKAELVVVNSAAHSLFWDVKVMYDMVVELQSENPVAAKALGLLTQVLNTTDLSNAGSILDSHNFLKEEFFNSEKDCKIDHDVAVLGHCHIDTAWLWTYAETKRKIIRSWSTQLKLMDHHDYLFVASQTIHFEWLQKENAELYNRVKEAVTEKKFVPVGGSYVEFDANIPSGESMIRQLLYGMNFLSSEFNYRPKVFWLPDTFGYSAQLPQILQGFGIPYFLSQKLSWNLFNK